MDLSEEEEFLFFQDLCARLPYGVKVRTNKGPVKLEGLAPFCFDEIRIASLLDWTFPASSYLPYLRPMSSMTEEERRDFPFPYYFEWIDSDLSLLHSDDKVYASIGFDEMYEIIDWLNKHHFDYRGLIKKGLALEAPKGTY